jgi:hypothetical protein
MSNFMKNLAYVVVIGAAVLFGYNQYQQSNPVSLRSPVSIEERNSGNSESSLPVKKPVDHSELEDIIKKAEEKPLVSPAINGGNSNLGISEFIDPDSYTGTSSDHGVEVIVRNIKIDTSDRYQMFATKIPVTIKIPNKEFDGKEIFVIYSHSEDAHYFIPGTGKVVSGKYNPSDDKVWFQTVLNSDGMKLRATPGSSKTTNTPGHCNQLYVYGIDINQAAGLPSDYGILGKDGFKELYSTSEFPLVMNDDPVLICTDISDIKKLKIKYPGEY